MHRSTVRRAHHGLKVGSKLLGHLAVRESECMVKMPAREYSRVSVGCCGDNKAVPLVMVHASPRHPESRFWANAPEIVVGHRTCTHCPGGYDRKRFLASSVNTYTNTIRETLTNWFRLRIIRVKPSTLIGVLGISEAYLLLGALAAPKETKRSTQTWEYSTVHGQIHGHTSLRTRRQTQGQLQTHTRTRT